MNYNLYKVNFNTEDCIMKISSSDLHKEISEKLNYLEENIIEIYKTKQRGRKGVENLGNEIRYNKNIKSVFVENEKFEIIKATGNRMSISNQLIDLLIKFSSKVNYLFIINSEFNRYSRLFDATSTSIEDIKIAFQNLNRLIHEKYKSRNIYIIEFTGFENYTFEECEGKYSRLITK